VNTDNASEFERVAGLKWEDWGEGQSFPAALARRLGGHGLQYLI